MKTVTLEMSEESAREILDVLQDQHDKHQSTANVLKAQIRQIQREFGLDTLSVVRTDQTNVPMPVAARPVKTPHGRNKKGHSRRLITTFLKDRNGLGATIKQISADTGTVYGTARRILQNELQKEGKVTLDKGFWRWVTT